MAHGSYDNEKLYTEEEVMLKLGISREKLHELIEQSIKELTAIGEDISDYFIKI